jgi:hypothetical protein
MRKNIYKVNIFCSKKRKEKYNQGNIPRKARGMFGRSPGATPTTMAKGGTRILIKYVFT